MPLQHPNIGKTSRFGGFGPFFPNFPNFPFFPFFSVFSVPFFPFFRFFRFLGGRVSEETVPQHSVCLPTVGICQVTFLIQKHLRV